MAQRRHPSHPRHNNTDESRERLRALREGTAQLNQELRTHTPGNPRRKKPGLLARRVRFIFFAATFSRWRLVDPFRAYRT